MSKRQVKLWHDDVRPPPDDSWVWARTNDQAKAFLLRNDVIECSLDHDMGGHDMHLQEAESEEEILSIMFTKGGDEENGSKLVMWMVEKNIVPPKIRIHSWNRARALWMARYLNDYGHDVEVREYNMRLDMRR